MFVECLRTNITVLERTWQTYTDKYEVRSKATPIIKHTQQQKRTRKAFRDRQATATFPNCNNRHRQSSYYSLLHVPCMWYVVVCVCVWNVYLGSVVPTPRYHIESITISFYGQTTGFFFIISSRCVCVWMCNMASVVCGKYERAIYWKHNIYLYGLSSQKPIPNMPYAKTRCALLLGGRRSTSTHAVDLVPSRRRYVASLAFPM